MARRKRFVQRQLSSSSGINIYPISSVIGAYWCDSAVGVLSEVQLVGCWLAVRTQHFVGKAGCVIELVFRTVAGVWWVREGPMEIAPVGSFWRSLKPTSVSRPVLPFLQVLDLDIETVWHYRLQFGTMNSSAQVLTTSYTLQMGL